MYSPEFVQALGRDRHHELLEAAEADRRGHPDAPETLFALARERLARRAARRSHVWFSGPMAGKPAHG